MTMKNCNCCITYNAPDLMDGGVTAARIEEEAAEQPRTPTPTTDEIEAVLHDVLPLTTARLGDEDIAEIAFNLHAALAEPTPEPTAAEVRKAQADALRSAVQDMGDWADEVYVTGDPLDEDTWADITTGEWLTARADTIEKEAVTW